MKYKEMLMEFYNKDHDAYVSSVNNNRPLAMKSDTKRTRLTFGHLHTLRQMRKVRRVEKIKHLGLVKAMYNPDSE